MLHSRIVEYSSPAGPSVINSPGWSNLIIGKVLGVAARVQILNKRGCTIVVCSILLCSLYSLCVFAIVMAEESFRACEVSPSTEALLVYFLCCIHLFVLFCFCSLRPI